MKQFNRANPNTHTGATEAEAGPDQPQPPTPPRYFTSSQKKQFHTLSANVQNLVDVFGVDRIGFLTLTFDRHRKTWSFKQASKRFNSMWTNFARAEFLHYISVKERHKDGSIHFHLVVVTKGQISCNHDEVQNRSLPRHMRYRSASPHLRALWEKLRNHLPRYQFGRAELLPVRLNAEAISRYVSKYLCKATQERYCPENADMKGARLVNYSKNCPRLIKGQFSWVCAAASRFRRFASLWAWNQGCLTVDQVREKVGSKWGWLMRQAFEVEGETERYHSRAAFNMHEKLRRVAGLQPWSEEVRAAAWEPSSACSKSLANQIKQGVMASLWPLSPVPDGSGRRCAGDVVPLGLAPG